MAPIGAERQFVDADRRVEIQRPIEMREQRAGARFLPFPGTGSFFRHDDEQHIFFAGAVTRRALDDLCGGREVQEPIAAIVGGAMIGLRGLRGFPFWAAREVIEETAHSKSLSIATKGSSAGGIL